MSETSFSRKIVGTWNHFKEKHPNLVQFFVFFMLSNGVTVLQLILMPLFKYGFNFTSLIDVNFQVGQVGQNLDGSPYFIFDYASGALATGGGGGLAYFFAVQITIAIAQVINFFAQRNITFKSNTNPWVAAMWYVIAYIFITIIAAAAQGWYKAPIYGFALDVFGAPGETFADVVTMIINSAISFWVFFPIFKVIFKQEKKDGAAPAK